MRGLATKATIIDTGEKEQKINILVCYINITYSIICEAYFYTLLGNLFRKSASKSSTLTSTIVSVASLEILSI